MAVNRKTDSEINSGEVNLAEKMMEKMTEMMNELKKNMNDQHEKLDRKLSDFQGEMIKEMNEVKSRLDKIEKITDRVEKNEQAIQEIKAENKEIKDKFEEINLNNTMEEASRSVYIHNVDVLIGMHEPRKQNLIKWTENNNLKPYVADVITIKAEDQTNAIFKGNNALAAKQIKDVLVKAKNDLKSQNKDFKTNNKGKKMYAGIDPYIPPQAKDDYEKIKTHAKNQKKQKNIHKFNIAIKPSGSGTSKQYGLVLDYITDEEGAKWKSITGNQINEKKRKITPLAGPSSKEIVVETQESSWTTVVKGSATNTAAVKSRPPPVENSNIFKVLDEQ